MKRGAGRRAPSCIYGWNVRVPPSTEREHVGLDAGLEKSDLERPVVDPALLADELVEPRLGRDAVAALVDVAAVRAAGWTVVQRDAKAHGRLSRLEHEVEIAGMEAEGDATVRVVQHGALLADRPFAGQQPVVAPERVGVAVRPALPTLAAEVGLRRIEL